MQKSYSSKKKAVAYKAEQGPISDKRLVYLGIGDWLKFYLENKRRGEKSCTRKKPVAYKGGSKRVPTIQGRGF